MTWLLSHVLDGCAASWEGISSLSACLHLAPRTSCQAASCASGSFTPRRASVNARRMHWGCITPAAIRGGQRHVSSCDLERVVHPSWPRWRTASLTPACGKHNQSPKRSRTQLICWRQTSCVKAWWRRARRALRPYGSVLNVRVFDCNVFSCGWCYRYNQMGESRKPIASDRSKHICEAACRLQSVWTGRRCSVDGSGLGRVLWFHS